MKQGTLKETITLQGQGLHLGINTTVKVLPAAPKHGIKFSRVDLEGAQLVEATTKNVVDTTRCTVLGKKETTISTVEHLLAALKATGVSNALVEINGPEVPIMDGSSLAFVEAINAVGVEAQEENIPSFEPKEPFCWKDETTGAEYTIIPADEFELSTVVDFGTEVVGTPYASMKSLKHFGTEIAPCRTFAFLHELEYLADQGLIKGGSLENALVFVQEKPSEVQLQELSKKLGVSEAVDVAENGILNTTELRFSNEAARHKLLDVIGDLALTGLDLKCKIIATKPGHTSNVALAKELMTRHTKATRESMVPFYDPSVSKSLFNINDIASKLQHRYPFLLIDKITELTEKYVVGVKNVTMNEPFFQGHFPGNPVMPGVLIIEAMAQTGGILVMEQIDGDPHEWDTFFLRINNAKFRLPVIPGDTLVFRLDLISPIRRGLCEMSAKAYVGGKLVAEAELLAQIIKRKQ
jgi:UDP-3-O-[3-hydroxymyristoyl] N-acetylglucosamine deacetylase/3-hydroxyacyl-[acyl-carrier-protein] dehydratase